MWHKLRMDIQSIQCVWIVDDHSLFREGLALVLESLRPGLQIEQLPGVEPLRDGIHDLATPDLILLDLHMPGPSGADAVREVRALVPSAALVALSGSDDPADRKSVV